MPRDEERLLVCGEEGEDAYLNLGLIIILILPAILDISVSLWDGEQD